jgi:hypothetical protein
MPAWLDAPVRLAAYPLFEYAPAYSARPASSQQLRPAASTHTEYLAQGRAAGQSMSCRG